MPKFVASTTLVALLIALAVLPAVVALLSPAECADLIACPAVLESVCGSDGNTYGNECELEIAACQTNNTTLQVAFLGECPNSSG